MSRYLVRGWAAPTPAQTPSPEEAPRISGEGAVFGGGEAAAEAAALAALLDTAGERRRLAAAAAGLGKHAAAGRRAAKAALLMAPTLEARGLEAAVRGVQARDGGAELGHQNCTNACFPLGTQF
jgi:hypothetical protein